MIRKIIALSITSLCFCLNGFGQEITYDKVGIGTKSAPRTFLDVSADISKGKLGAVFGRLPEGDQVGDGTFLGVRGYDSRILEFRGKSFALEHSFYGKINSSINFFRGGGEDGGFIGFNTNKNLEKMRIDQYGNLGIGTINPKAFLDIGGDITNGKLGAVLGRLPEGNAEGEGTFLGVRGYNTDVVDGKSFSLEHSFYGITNSSVNFHRSGNSEDGFISFNTGKNVERVRIDKSGNVGIGTTTPTAKLSVNGNLWATEIQVATSNPWPDYVFEPSHEKLSLTELESFIQTNKHLPEIPTAKTIEKDGINLGDMNGKLLKKIEELTLYAIEQDKRLNTKDKELSVLKDKMTVLGAKLDKFINSQKK